MCESYGTYVNDEYVDNHDYDDDDDDDTDDDTDDETDDGWRANRDRSWEEPYTFTPPHRGRGCVQISGIWIPSGRGKGRG